MELTTKRRDSKLKYSKQTKFFKNYITAILTIYIVFHMELTTDRRDGSFSIIMEHFFWMKSKYEFPSRFY